jgi:2-haloacid dehalogenase
MQNREIPFKPQVIFIDMYETMLDMTEVERRLNHLLDSKRGYTLWFELLMQHCFADNSYAQFHPFSDIAKATMQMTGKMLGRPVEESAINDLLLLLEHLPVHDGVPEGLSRLKDEGFSLAALTNAPLSIVRNRMEFTGMISYFDAVLSSEAVKKYKPAKEVYQWALEQMDATAENALVVTTHGWDIAGAANAGIKTAYVRQQKRMLYPLAPTPDIVCQNLDELATHLTGVERSEV